MKVNVVSHAMIALGNSCSGLGETHSSVPEDMKWLPYCGKYQNVHFDAFLGVDSYVDAYGGCKLPDI
jgi:hypothetical protein